MRADSWDTVDPAEATAVGALRGPAMPFRASMRSALEGTDLGAHELSLDSAAAAGSGNFSVAIPIVSFPARGNSKFELSLFYNSRIWQRLTTNRMVFDIDHDWPAPGWTFGFARLVRAAGSRCILIEDEAPAAYPSR